MKLGITLLLFSSLFINLTLAGEALVLTATEFRILHYMACHPGRVFSRDQILSQALREDTIVVDRNIDVHIRAIRKKIDAKVPAAGSEVTEATEATDYIETIRGIGYRFRDLS